MRKATIIVFLLFFSLSSVFSVTRKETFVNGFDREKNCFSYTSTGLSKTETVQSSLAGLKLSLVDEIKRRMADLDGYFNGEGTDDFLRYFMGNLSLISRDAMKKAKHSELMNTPSGGYAVTYYVRTADLENSLNEYLSMIPTSDEKFESRNSEIKSVNRFYRGKYLDGDLVSINIVRD